MRGLMQDVPLTVELLVRRAETTGRDVPVISVDEGGRHATTWGRVARRARALAGVLDALGAAPGATVGTFAWNTHRHLELYLGVPAAGRVLHTANVRLHADDVVHAVRHAGDAVLFVDASLTGALAEARDRLPCAFVVLDDGGEVHPAFAGDPSYEALVREAGGDEPPPPAHLAHAEARPADGAPREDDAASVCFTSGTTGRPKAVVYSHRSVLLHSYGALGVDSHGVSRHDVLLPLTPMFHVNCWGLPFTAALAGASLVLPGRDTSPETAAALVEAEGVTVAAGVPTLWVWLLQELEQGGRDLSSLRRVLSGGAESPDPLVRRYGELGIDYFHGWGATELSPSGTAAVVRAGTEDPKWGPTVPGVEVRLRGEDGAPLPWDDEAAGEIEVRGAWVVSAYLDPEDDSNERRFAADGWFRTGDVACVAPDGALRVVDREKDLVKSGGEWISSLELERAVLEHEGVVEAAVVAVPHAEWGERPAVVLVADGPIDVAALREHLEGRVARWWIPDHVEVVDEIPRTGVGKHDKRRLRDELAARLADAG